MNKSKQYIFLALLVFFTSNFLFAQSGSSFSFDGTSNSYATIPNNSALEFSTGTIEFWVNPGNYVGAGGMIALRDGTGTRFSLHLDVDNNVIGLWNGTDYRTIASPLSTGSWSHIAYVFKATATDIYINGSYSGSLDKTLNTTATGQALTLGQNGQGFESFTGQIDELRIWNDERTASEISSSYQLELGGFEENLVAYYNFDEGTSTTSINLVGNAVGSATLQSGATWGTNTTGLSTILTKAVSFDGTDDKVTVPNNAALESNDQTIEFWVKPNYSSLGYSPGLIGMRDASQVRFSLHMTGDRSKLSMWTGNYSEIAYSFTQGTWYHIAIVMNSGTSSSEVFVNGSSIGTMTNIHSNITGKELTIGQSGGGGEQFNGEIDEVRVWNIVRTAQEISDNYQTELTGQQPNLVAYYRFNEGSGTTTRNWVQNGISDGTLQNGVLWTDHDFIMTETTASQPLGSGTELDPYLISNLAELRWFSENVGSWSAYLKQTADIDASETAVWYDSLGYSPAGNGSIYFTGNYDGNGHTINGLTINRPGQLYVGLCGFITNNGTVKNLGMTNVNIEGLAWVGAISGATYPGIVSNCYSSGSVKGNDYYLIPSTAFSVTGGLVGDNGNGGYISNSYSRANVTGLGINVGGLVGSNSSTVDKCYSTGLVQGGNWTGGLVGRGTGPSINSYWDIETSGTTASEGGIGLAASDMKTICPFLSVGWDFETETDNGTENIWDIDRSGSYNDGYPFLAWENGSTVSYSPDANEPGGCGTSTYPYLISSLNNLNWVSENNSSWASTFKQTADIDASATSTWNSGAGFSPIGIQDAVNFSGVYDGDGHTITGLTINRSSEHNIALFGYTNGAQIKNLGLYNVNINGTQGVGGIAGIANYSSSITNCFTTGVVTCNSNFSYGLNLSYAGGIAGYIYSSSLNNCYSKTSIEGNSGYAGGLVGYVGNGTSIDYCYSTGTIAGDGEKGGLVGYLEFGVTPGAHMFWDKESSNMVLSYAGTPKTTAEMKTASTFADAGWDMTGNVWKIDGTGTMNNGYPFLAWQSTDGEPLPVELTSFTAASTNSSVGEPFVVLKWKTATEVDNYGFEIERTINSGAKSDQSRQWEKIGFVEGAGNSNSPKEYKFTDNSKIAGLSRSYRLKQIDQEGQYTYSDEVEVTLELPGKYELMQNYPNPFNPSTTIRFNLPENANVKLVIYNILGEQVSTLFDKEFEAGFHKETFNAAGLASGVYVYMLHAKSATNSGNEFNDVKKMILLR